VRSPREGEWIRTNPDPLYCQEVVMGRIKDGTEHIIAPEIVDQVVALAIKNLWLTVPSFAAVVWLGRCLACD